MAVVNIIVSGAVGSGKSALAYEVVIALRALGLEVEAVGFSASDVDGDPTGSLDIYRDGLKVLVSESLLNEHMVERRVGGSYEMPDRPGFWIDAPVAREIARRALGLSPSSNDRRSDTTGAKHG